MVTYCYQFFRCRLIADGKLLELFFLRADLIDRLVGSITLRLDSKLLLLGSRDIAHQTLMLGGPIYCVGR
jgi:hypothetical protein